MAAIGLHIFYKTAKDSPIKSLAWLEEKKDSILNVFKQIFYKESK